MLKDRVSARQALSGRQEASGPAEGAGSELQRGCDGDVADEVGV